MSSPVHGSAWVQFAFDQSDIQQDELMDTACDLAFPGTSSASIDEIVAGIGGLPSTNTTGEWLLGTCPNCEGMSVDFLVETHARNCVAPGDPFPSIDVRLDLA